MAIPNSYFKKTVAVCFVLSFFVTSPALSQSCPAQGMEIFPDLTGQELIDTLITEYKTDAGLSYNAAREEMYGEIDNIDGIVEGIYTGYQAQIDPDGGPILGSNGQADIADINAEHAWPQSKGAIEGTLAHSDMHHLYPAYESANSSRNNHPYYEIPDEETEGWWRYDTQFSNPVADSIDYYSEKRNTHPSEFYSGSWEPRESVEGDIARSMFYFYTMYKDQANEADPYFFEIQKNFLRSWNALDVVSQREYDRTCAIALHQDNKVNPFVIDPTLVDRAYFEGQIGETNVEFAGTSFLIGEGRGTFEVEVSIINPNPDTATTIEVIYAGGTATAGEDFDAFTAQTLTFPAGSLTRQSISLHLTDDDLREEEETILLELQNPGGPEHTAIGAANSVEIRIRDNDGETPTDAWINEFHYDNVSTDEGEFVEIAVNTKYADLTDVTLTLYNGNGGQVYASYSGNDFTTGSSRQGISFYYVDLPANGIQNGDEYADGISLDINGNLLQFLSYEGTFIAADGPAQDIESTDIGVYQSNSTPIGSSLSLKGTGSGYDDFNWENTPENTKGDVNTNQTIDTPSSNEKEIGIAGQFKLHQNYPNPFNPFTVISYQLAENSEVSLEVFDMLGRKVADLVAGERKAAGNHQVAFEAGNLSSGVYIYRLSTNSGQQLTRKMLLMK